MRAPVVVLALLVAPPAFAADPEPKYEGKPLPYWVQRLQKAETDKDRDDAAEALKAFGPDAAPALPTFIEMLADHSPTYRARVIDIVAAIGPKAKDARPVIAKRLLAARGAPHHYADAVAAMVAISPEPKDAVADLVPLLGKHDWNASALRAICAAGPDAKDAIPAIRKYVRGELAAKEKDSGVYIAGFRDLAKLGPDVVPLLVELLDSDHARDDALACLEVLGPKAKGAVPALVKFLKHADAEVRCRSAVLLWRLEKDPAGVPVLAELLKADPTLTDGRSAPFGVKSNIAADAARALGEIGPAARAALPQLRSVVAIGLPASVLSRASFELGTERHGDTVYVRSGSKGYEASVRCQALADAGRAAADAIDKIEQGPRK
ncbi:MAG: HEAT repeat domain-containing protein [Planctomycetes bacterium]|nr:HEAT repeat domain-containing protein [Planctomycetota bacterium]